TDAMEDGAWGLSTGLIYAPGSYSETAEIVAVARAAARYRGFYASHIRGEGATLLDAIREAISVGREGELPVQVSHVKAAGRPNWGNVPRALALIDAARAEGTDVRADAYPYTGPSTTLRTLLPDWAPAGGSVAMRERRADPTDRARVLGEYAREQRTLSLATAVHKMTGLPAARLGLRDRGVLRTGARADLVVFDARRVADRATYEDPHRYPDGIEHVIVNGRFVIKHGEHTGSLPGRVLTPP